MFDIKGGRRLGATNPHQVVDIGWGNELQILRLAVNKAHVK